MKWAYYNDSNPYVCEWTKNLIKAGLVPDGEVDCRSIADVQPSDLRGFRQAHFFSGIGGWSYALRLAGWPDDRFVWTGSPPCQPFSSAGKRRGYADERDLWPAFFRLIEQCRPAVVFGEQVASADVLGANIDSDVLSVWSAKTILGISERLKGAQVPALQGLHQAGRRGIAEDEAQDSAGEQGMAKPKPGMVAGFLGARSSESEGLAARYNISRNPGPSDRRLLRGNGHPFQPDGGSGLELPISGSNRAGQGLYARQYQSGDLRLQRHGECVGRTADFRSLDGDIGAAEAELERLVAEIGRETEGDHRLEWLTRIRTDLERCSYYFGASILPSCGVGAPHIRQRLFWVADAGRDRCDEQFRPSGGEAGSRQRRDQSDDCGTNGGLGHSHEPGREAQRPVALRGEPRSERAAEPGASGRRVGDAAFVGRGQERPITGRGGERDSTERAAERPGPGFWSDAEWLQCLDGKARRVKRGIFPLAARLPSAVDGLGPISRVGALKGAGNAIVPQIAAQFIAAFMEAQNAQAY